MIARNPDWLLVEIYADEGVSGTSMKKRINFMRMLADCDAGKIDLIVTKSVSRFTRNTKDCLDVVRQLKSLNPPVGILFEMEGFNTADTKNEFMLGVLSLVAQGESESKSAAILWSIIQRFKKGMPIFSTHNLLGYDKNLYGEVVVAEDEAEVVKYIYSCYMDDLSAREIAESLTERHIPTVTGKEVWSSSAILNILRNEKYCGNSLMQKTFTIDCFSHKSVKNRGQRTQYFQADTHPAIIPPKDWEIVQEQLLKRKGSSARKIIPVDLEFCVATIKRGRLKGFVFVDLKWKNKELDKFFKKLNLK